jgi:hypothetical protein
MTAFNVGKPFLQKPLIKTPYDLCDLPGVNPATNDRMILYYRLMTKVDWFSLYYGIFLGGLSHSFHHF